MTTSKKIFHYLAGAIISWVFGWIISTLVDYSSYLAKSEKVLFIYNTKNIILLMITEIPIYIALLVLASSISLYGKRRLDWS